MKKTLLYADIIPRLGFRNVAYVAWYRLGMRAGFRKRFFPQKTLGAGRDFLYPAPARQDYPENWKKALLDDAGEILKGRLRYYGRHWKTVGTPPDWFLNPFNNARYPDSLKHWADLADFHPLAGDIKNIWEASRFEWGVTLARAHAASGDEVFIDTLNHWLENWALHNPLNTGPNWKCGQEAAIRVFNLLQAALILDQWDRPAPRLESLIFRHLERIQPNIRYAVAQDNNHGTSEAAALFIGGHWLLKTRGATAPVPKAIAYAREGRRRLENRIQRLIEPDGSFSQHSVTYHRLLLDTLIFVEYWRKKLDAEPFSDRFYGRVDAAINWLAHFTDPVSGNAPNLGANDGALLLNPHGCGYRDFRPTLQTAGLLLQGKRYFGPGPWDEPLYWYGLPVPDKRPAGLTKTGTVLPSGYVIMAGEGSWAVLRFPMYRFRPSHNDVFHFDLWYNGQNICRDAGSYSYNPDREADTTDFKSVKAHNTVSFDGKEQMPRVGRFLLGKWIRPEHVGAIETIENGGQRWTGAYRDYRGNRHQRTVTWRNNTWIVEDDLSGPFETAETLYRLIPGEYRIDGNTVIAPWGFMTITATDCDIRLGGGLESLYYWEKQPVRAVVVHVGRGAGRVAVRFDLEERF